jgi:hypothetical protein
MRDSGSSGWGGPGALVSEGTRKVRLHAEHGTVAFTWTVTDETAQVLAKRLRREGWTVTISADRPPRHEDEPPGNERPENRSPEEPPPRGI